MNRPDNQLVMRIRLPKQVPVETDEVGPVYARDQSGAPVCGSRKQGSKAGSKHTLCQRRDRQSPSGRCRLHGGSPGSGRPVVTGRYSRSLPRHLLADYDAALLSPDLGSMREAIAVQDALIQAYLRGLNDVPSEEHLRLAQRAIEGALTELMTDEPHVTTLTRLLTEAQGALGNVVTNREKEREVRQCLKERAELVKAESVRVEKEAKYLSIEQVMALMAALVAIVNENVKQESIRGNIAAALSRLCNNRVIEGDISSGSSRETQQELPPSSTSEAETS